MVKENLIRSPFFYVGDKYRILSQILPYFPTKINTYIEPFVGGGSVFLNVNAEKFVLKQGAIETSNTSLVNEMIGMINVTRGYETLSKFLKEESTLLSKAIQVGRVGG